MNCVGLFLFLSIFSGYTGGFQEGDWVNYTNFRYVTSVAMDQNVVYFGTTGGVIRYDRYAQKWLDPLTVTDGIPNEQIDDIAYDPDTGRIWVSTPGGNAYYQPTFRQWYTGGEFPIELSRNDFSRSKYPILTTEFGYSYQDGVIRDMTLQEYTLTRGVSDDYDSLYVGTWGMGPVVINTRYGDLYTMPYGPYSGYISAVVKLDGSFWVGDNRLSGGALTRYDRNEDKWYWFLPRYTDGLASSRLTSGVSVVSNDIQTVWLGTEYGLEKYRPGDDEFSSYADFSTLPSVLVFSVTADSLGVFAGTDNGLGFISAIPEKKRKDHANSTNADTASGNSTHSVLFPAKSLTGMHVNCVEIIGEYLYLGTDRGVLRRLLESNSQFEYVNTPEKMLSTEIYDIAAIGDSLYFLTYRDIQIVNIKTEQSSTLTDPSYFDSWQMRKLAVTHSNIWAATDIGLWKYRISDGYSRLFTVNDGMISDDIQGLVLDGDYIWLATPGALIRFYWNDPGRVD